jgi:L-threonylcarbamoyladenylate synthase
MIIDGGEVGIGLESMIIDLSGLPESPPLILRPGRITQEMLQAVLGEVGEDPGLLKADSSMPPKAPGMKYRHYAPRGILTIVEGPREQVIRYINAQTERCRGAGRKTGVICTDETAGAYQADVVKSAGSRTDEETVAHSLFRILREFDEEGAEVLYSESFADGSFSKDAAEGIGQAIMNRLIKAAGHRVIKVQQETTTGKTGGRK